MSSGNFYLDLTQFIRIKVICYITIGTTTKNMFNRLQMSNSALHLVIKNSCIHYLKYKDD